MTARSSNSDEKRNFIRVETFLNLTVRQISDEEGTCLKARYAIDMIPFAMPHPHEVADKAINEWFLYLNAKLDVILSLLKHQQADISCELPRKVNISEGGMNFFHDVAFPNDSILEIKVMLPMFPPVFIIVYGKVVSCRKDNNGYQVGVSFLEMEEDIRDEIFRFVFKIQRDMLREKRG